MLIKQIRAGMLFLFLALVGFGQTFRGEIRGQVEDSSAAAVPEALVKAINVQTGFARSTVSGTSGDYSLPELPLGTYVVTVTKAGFAEQKSSNVEVQVSKVVTLTFRLQVAQQAETVQVSAAAAQIETSSTALTGVVETKTIRDLPINGRDFRQMLKLVPGVGPGTSPSVNGNRTRGNNFQIDGADNNDGFQNAAAVNQGGVSGIAGTLLPVDALDQFAIQTNGSAEVGRNPGALVNLVIKSGTNQIHGSGYYFNRNEYFAAKTPFQRDLTKSRPIRNNQGGFSLGGPIIQNKLFYFLTGEIQKANAGVAEPVTTPSAAWVNDARSILTKYGVAVNPVSANLLGFFPARTLTGERIANNYTVTDPNIYDSYNGIVKIDYVINEKHSLAARYFGGTGKQIARVGTGPSDDYYQVAPSRMHNVSVALNSVLTPRIVNNLVLGTNYFLQTFGDNNRSFNPIAAGLNTGVSQAGSLAGSPTINISGFAQIGVTQPLGRIDTTGHITDTLSWVLGRHSLKIGGEYRRANLDIFYQQNRLGTFNFDGTAGPWSKDALTDGPSSLAATRRALADFLAGYVRPSNGSTIALGELQRDYRQNSYDLFIHDTFQINSRLTLNYGLRYNYTGPLYDTEDSISTFVPGKGIVGPGTGLDHLYQPDRNNFAPRAGFAWKVLGDKTVIRGSYGIFYDVPAVSFFASNNPGNGGALGVNANPGGKAPVYSVTASGYTLTAGNPIFGSSPVPPYGVFSVNQDFATPYTQNYNLNIQRELWRGGIVQAGYVGSLGRKLVLLRNINQAVPGTGTVQSRRPFNSLYPTFATINELETSGSSYFHSLQLQYTQSNWHGITTQVAYTYGKTIDTGSEPRNGVIANAYNRALERGPAAFDVRHFFNAFVSYSVPVYGKLPKRLAEGWQINTLMNFHTGQPIDLRAGTDVSGTGNFSDRVDVVGSNPYAGANRNVVRNSSNTSSTVQWFNPAAFARPATGTFGNIGRNAVYGPAFGAVDPSIFKTTKLTERVSLQIRMEVFNVFNRLNLANPGTSLASSTTFGIITNTRNGGGAPGLGFGEPRNVQFAARIQF